MAAPSYDTLRFERDDHVGWLHLSRPEKLNAFTPTMWRELGDLGSRVGDDPVPTLGLLLLGYPLQPAGRPDRRRDGHFAALTMPVCFVSGTRDALAPRAELTRATKRVAGPVTLHWLESADHGYRPLKSSGRTIDDVLAEVAETSVRWVQSLPKRHRARRPA